MNRKRTIFLAYPEFDKSYSSSSLLELPLPVVHVAEPLVQLGYDVRIIDGRVESSLEKALDNVRDPICAGISCFFGQVRDGLRIWEGIKEKFPRLPVVWGGWLPTTLHRELIQDKHIDIIVRGEGEVTFTRLVERMAEGENDFANINGLTYSSNGKTVIADDATPCSTYPTGHLPYHLVDKERYEWVLGRASHVSSRGCPYKCGFCCMVGFYKGRWVGKSAEELVNDLIWLSDEYCVRTVNFQDDAFFVSRRRVMEFAERLIESSIEINWRAKGAVKNLLKLEEEDYSRLSQSGCLQIDIGVESGSEAALSMLGKHHRNSDLFRVASRMFKNRIKLCAFVMVDFPGEKREDYLKTAEVLRDLRGLTRRRDDLWVALFMYNPCAHTKLHLQELENGSSIEFYTTLDEMATVPENDCWINIPWAPSGGFMKRYRDREQGHIRAFYLWLSFAHPKVYAPWDRSLRHLLFKILKLISDCRLKLGVLRFPVEWQLYSKIKYKMRTAQPERHRPSTAAPPHTTPTPT
ncbi:MAG: B12-binding domain-containing radical SAM protein [Candidatus Zixiibacteriota bacterium]